MPGDKNVSCEVSLITPVALGEGLAVRDFRERPANTLWAPALFN